MGQWFPMLFSWHIVFPLENFYPISAAMITFSVQRDDNVIVNSVARCYTLLRDNFICYLGCFLQYWVMNIEWIRMYICMYESEYFMNILYECMNMNRAKYCMNFVHEYWGHSTILINFIGWVKRIENTTDKLSIILSLLHFLNIILCPNFNTCKTIFLIKIF